MTTTRRTPPLVLLVHNGNPQSLEYLTHLIDSGLRVIDAHRDEALTLAIEDQPDIIVLDFEVNGDTLAELKGHDATRPIPVIALAELARPPHDR